MPNEEVTPGGSRVLRHDVGSQRELGPAHGDPGYIERVNAHVEKYVGTIAMVWHEIVSAGIHLDVLHVSPTQARPFHTFVTCGMGEKPMTVPQGIKVRFAELTLSLPASWPVTREAFADEANYWPIRWLKNLGRMPLGHNTWLAPGHTVPNGDPPLPFRPGQRITDFGREEIRCQQLVDGVAEGIAEAVRFIRIRLRDDPLEGHRGVEHVRTRSRAEGDKSIGISER